MAQMPKEVLLILVSCDASQLEWRVAALLSQDEVMIREIVEGMDAHSYNCEHILKLPVTSENRTATKVFTFRMIYGGTAYAFYMDNNMPSFSLKKWEQIVEDFYNKYKGLHAWQKKNFMEVCQNEGRLVSPITGRIWQFTKAFKNGSWNYKWAEVCNYPVQGTAFDFISLWMVLCNKELSKYPEVKLCMQVHDEILYDCPDNLVDTVAKVCYHIILELDKKIEQFFQCPCNVPFAGEVKVGPTWGETKLWSAI